VNAFIVASSCGEKHCLLLDERGTVFSFGSNNKGQLGRDSTGEISPLIKPITTLPPVTQISTGKTYSMVLSSEGDVYTFGENDDGMCGTGHSGGAIKTPHRIQNLPKIVFVACGGYHSVIISDIGQVYTFGYGNQGQLGLGKGITNSVVPAVVNDLIGLVVIGAACSFAHTMCLTDKGDVYVFGWGTHGKLGLGDLLDRQVPVLLKFPGEEKIVSLGCGAAHSFAMTVDGEMYTWGYSKYGQLGIKKDLVDKEHEIKPLKIKNFATNIYFNWGNVSSFEVNIMRVWPVVRVLILGGRQQNSKLKLLNDDIIFEISRFYFFAL